MRCDKVKESIIDFVYNESGIPQENVEIQEHLRTCPACLKELEELTQARKYLQLWEDEPPLRSVAWARNHASAGKSSRPYRPFSWRYLRYGAIAAMALITLLALANAQIAWNRDGFSFSTHVFPGQVAEPDYYTKTELRNLLKEVLDDSESRMNEINYLMMQEVLKTVEQDRWMDLSMIRSHSVQSQNN